VKLLQKLKYFLQPKTLRLLALGMILIASLFLLIQDNYGTEYMVALGPISGNQEEKSAEIKILVSNVLAPSRLDVSASWILHWQLKNFNVDTEFLAVVHSQGEKLVFERIYVLVPPEALELQGPRWEAGMRLGMAVGTKPELVEMIGLDRFGYRLTQPAWAKQKLPGADIVYYQQGREAAVKNVLDGDSSYVPDLFLIDAQRRVMGMRQISGRLLTLPEILRQAALWLYILAVILGLSSFTVYKLPSLKSAGSRIWDQVSMRWRKPSS
jgi:hypothetical protein